MQTKNTQNYEIIMPFDEKTSVKHQFGLLPLSIMEFKNQDKWKSVYWEQDETSIKKKYADSHKHQATYNYNNLGDISFSEFSSAICEFIVKYYSLGNANIVDPFAGRGTRAIISSKLKRNYFGYEISPQTYNKNLKQFKKCHVNPTLYLNDGCKMENTDDEFAHLVFSCPPYGRVEKYESVEGQLSDIKKYEDFLEKIKECAKNVVRVLKPGGFFVWVCADWRENQELKQFGFDSNSIFKEAGLLIHDFVIIKNNSPFAN